MKAAPSFTPMYAAVWLTVVLLCGRSAHADEPASLDLRAVLAAAAVHSPDARVLATRAAEAEARVQTAFGQLLPRLSLTGTVTRNNREVRAGDRAVVNLWDYNSDIRAEVTLFNGRAVPDWLAANADVQAERARVSWAADSVQFEAGRAYFIARTASRQLAVAERGVRTASATRDYASVRLEGGDGIEEDVLRADVALAEARALREQASADLDSSLRALAYAIGRESLPASALGEPSDWLASEAAMAPDLDWSADANGDMLALAHVADAEDLREMAGLLALLPTLTLGANAFFGRPTFRAPDGVFWTVTLNASWTLFDYGRYGVIDAARAREAQARAQWEQLSDMRRRDVELSRIRRRAGLRRLEHARDALRSAEALRDQVRLRFERGGATSLELVEADASVVRADAAVGLTELQIATDTLEQAWLLGQLSPEPNHHSREAP